MASAKPLAKQFVEVDGKQMAYYDSDGQGDSILFLHGNPTSSYLWRNVIPHLQNVGRCIAPDLIGMGDSEKLDDSGPDRYTYMEHREYLNGLLDAVELGDNVTLVIHDWGSGLGFDWASRHQDRVRGICYMEAIVCPVTWDDWPDAAKGIFQGFRSPAGDAMVLEKNVFVERVLPGSVLRELTDEEMEVYRAPYIQPGEDRRPTLTWPRQLPMEGEPAEVVEIVQHYADWMSQSDIPKLFINADPGAILMGRQREFCRSWPNQTEVTVAGNHFLQEDSYDEIGTAIKEWMASLS